VRINSKILIIMFFSVQLFTEAELIIHILIVAAKFSYLSINTKMSLHANE
jgi:hypothetical protein